ncbi:ROK family transcriptional regulator [Auraticoccus monumenti]|uniref:Sugar kinase of the NBD/HSP70 family, may contain an N-terminal HTH domain n=1 Tax=Auraticoccus monumenti TaxID=675864 RepID=A0A1G6ZWS3_9ACTN|nr:ROK family transcriptional regulator [Auraticoccus monumenti]SDE06999.1 Sugar kinase of the NBD/HSP70 family, may contain an N-terminal HTH domain [Auraticoccus monumenti]
MSETTAQRGPRGTARLRQLNTRQVLSALREATRPVSIAELAASTSLTRPTVAQIVAGLEERRWLRRHEPIAANGRPAARYGLAHESIAVFGIDVGAHRTVVELAGLDGTTRARREARRAQSLNAETLRAVGSMVEECLAEGGLETTGVVAGTVATPGIIDPVTGSIVLRRHLGTWDAHQISSDLARCTVGRVTVENDASLAALAMSDLPGVPASFLGLQWGQRLGAGVVLAGQVYRGRTGAAGELGSLLLPDPVTGEVSQLEDVVRASRLPLLGGLPDLSTEELAQAAQGGDPGAQQALRRAVDALAAAVAPTCLALDLQVVTVSGAIARCGPALTTALRDALAAHGAVGVELLLSPFLEDTVLRGAVTSATEAGWDWLLERCGAPGAAPVAARP